jgi:hypothetical protein
LTEPENVPEAEERQHLEVSQVVRERYWDGKFILTNVILVLLAVVAGYLQYVVYPALMTSPTPPAGYGFGETNVVLTLSFLTFQFSATNPNCLTPGCVLKGVPAFDFCQALIYLAVVFGLARYVRLRTK